MEYLDPTQVLEVIKNLGAITSLVFTLWSLWEKVQSLSRKRTKACKKIQ